MSRQKALIVIIFLLSRDCQKTKKKYLFPFLCLRKNQRNLQKSNVIQKSQDKSTISTLIWNYLHFDSYLARNTIDQQAIITHFLQKKKANFNHSVELRYDGTKQTHPAIHKHFSRESFCACFSIITCWTKQEVVLLGQLWAFPAAVLLLL